MTTTELFRALLAAEKVADVETALHAFEAAHRGAVRWVPLGRENNQGMVGAGGDPGRSLVERLTNGIDAVLEAEYERHQGRPHCRSPKDAATAWLNVPGAGLSEMSEAQRRDLAKRVVLRVAPGEGKESRVVEVRDQGVGLTAGEMPGTILSLNESNKMRKHHLVGVYGQGGSSTFAVSKYTLIASRRQGQNAVGFSIVCFRDVPPEEEEKIGHYAYLAYNGAVPEVASPPGDEFPAGTLVKHFGYDLSDYSAKIGPTSVYGLISQTLFDPVVPVWLDDYSIHDIRRVMKGSRNALNGAVDDGDEERRGTSVPYHMPLYHVSIGEFGSLGIEYWVLDRATRTNKNPTRAFVNPNKPVILTQNGQSHGELSVVLVKKNAELPYLAQRLICHVDCNSLSALAKRALFVTNREDARRGLVLNLIQEELVKALVSDDELKRLNEEAKDLGLRERDETAVEDMRREVARLLRTQGIDLAEAEGGELAEVETTPDRPIRPGPGPRPRPQPITPREPPTYIRLLWPAGQEITFHSEQRHYIRIETDAGSNYHNPNNPAASRINIIRPAGAVLLRGSSPLAGGRMRVVFEGAVDAQVGVTGTIRVELNRPGLPVLWDERPFRIVERPPSRTASRRVALPKFDWVAVDGPESQKWINLSWPDNANIVACTAQMEDRQLVIYYSTVFPKYAQQRTALERRDTALAASFTRRYEIWLAVHSRLFHQDQQVAEAAAAAAATRPTAAEADPEAGETRERQERCRMATLAALFAAREVETPAMTSVEVD